MTNEKTPLVDQITKKIGLPTESGTIKLSRGKYYFVTEKTRRQILVNTSTETELTNLVGKKVIAVLSGKTVVTFLPFKPQKPFKPPRIICYIPAPDLIIRIDQQVERTIRDQFVKEGILSKAQAKILANIESFRH